MKMNTFFNKITDNWLSKVVCIAIAIFIYIFHTVASLEKKTFDVPLKVVNDGIMASTSLIPSTVQVTIRTSSQNMALINTSANLKAFIYLTENAQAGVFEEPVNIEIENESILLDPLEVTVAPSTVIIALNEKVQKYISVEPMIVGKIDPNYELIDTVVSPSSVKVIGAKNIVENTQGVYTKKININGAIKSFTVPITLDRPPPLLSYDEKEEIKVTFSIKARVDTKVWHKVQLLVQNLNTNLKIDNAIPLITFEIEGTKSEIEKYKLSDKTVYIDCSAIKEAGNYDMPVKFYFPPKISLKESNIKTISIQVSQKELPKPDTEDSEVLQEQNEKTESSSEVQE